MATRSLGTLTLDLVARIGGFTRGMTEAERIADQKSREIVRKQKQRAQEVERAWSTAKGVMASAFGAFGLTLGAAGIAVFAKSNIDAADALNDLSDRVGVSVKDLASLQMAATLADTSLESIGSGISRLSRTMGDAERGNRNMQMLLTELGVTARDPKEAFFQLADAVKRMEDPSQRASVLNQVLGKSYQELLPLLQQGGDALRESAAKSETFADAIARLAPEAGRLNDELDAMKQGIAGFSAQILAVTTGPMAEWVASTNKLIERHGVLLGLLASVAAAAAPGVTASQLAGSSSVQAFRDQLAEARKELATIESAQRSGTFGLIQLMLYGSEDEMRRKGDYLRSNIKTLEASIQQFEERRRTGKAPSAIPTIDIPGLSVGSKGSTSDPLASLLAGTDIGRLKEFDKQVALLNQRYESGRVGIELYNQAMTKLVETTFATNFTEHNKQMAEQAETQGAVDEHLQATTEVLHEQNRAWVEAGRTIEEEYKPPLQKLEERLAYLDELFRRGVISAEAYHRAYADAFENVGNATKQLEQMDSFAKKAAENIQDAFADFLFDPFDKGLKGMLQGFGQMIQRMIADAVAADLARQLFGDLAKGGTGSGLFGDLLSGIGKMFNFANGGIMTSAGPLALNAYAGGGIANSPQLALFGEGSRPEAFVPLPDGRRIPVALQEGSTALNTRSAGVNVTQIFNGIEKPKEARRAAAQGLRDVYSLYGESLRYV